MVGTIRYGTGTGVLNTCQPDNIEAVYRIRIGFYADPNPDRGFCKQKFEKIYSWKNIFIFLIKTSIYLTICLHKGQAPKLQENDPALQNIEIS